MTDLATCRFAMSQESGWSREQIAPGVDRAPLVIAVYSQPVAAPPRPPAPRA